MGEYSENLMNDEEVTKNKPEEAMIQKEIVQAVQNGIKQLPEKLQTVLYMYYTAEMSVDDISRTLHIPTGTVKSRLHKGRNLLKVYLEDLDYE